MLPSIGTSLLISQPSDCCQWCADGGSGCKRTELSLQFKAFDQHAYLGRLGSYMLRHCLLVLHASDEWKQGKEVAYVFSYCRKLQQIHMAFVLGLQPCL